MYIFSRGQVGFGLSILVFLHCLASVYHMEVTYNTVMCHVEEGTVETIPKQCACGLNVSWIDVWNISHTDTVMWSTKSMACNFLFCYEKCQDTDCQATFPSGTTFLCAYNIHKPSHIVDSHELAYVIIFLYVAAFIFLGWMGFLCNI
jgi:hypothetical protein